MSLHTFKIVGQSVLSRIALDEGDIRGVVYSKDGDEELAHIVNYAGEPVEVDPEGVLRFLSYLEGKA